MRRWLVGFVALVALAAFGPGARADDEMWRSFRGKVMFSDVALAPQDSFESPALMASALRRIQRSTVDQSAGFWRLHVLAFLDRPASSGTLALRATDVTDPRVPRQVRVFELPVERGAKELRLDDFVVTEAEGFVRGSSYEISVEPPREEGVAAADAKKAGKADAYAKGVITLR